MMRASDRVYVVSDGDRRNTSLEPFLADVIESRIWQVYQLDLMKSHPSIWHNGIRVGSLECLLQELTSGSIHKVVNVSRSSRAATVLAEQTRRADLSPPSLQVIHEQVGSLLADKLLDEFSFENGLVEETDFRHVQGSAFSGLVTRSRNVVILAMMRGGEPMARGVFSKFPYAKFVHYYEDQPLGWTAGRTSDLMRIFIVDSVVNRGNSVRRELHHLAEASSRGFEIYVLSAVIHQDAADALPKEYPLVRFLTLRVSTNQYTGRGGTDTGNRLFGTM